MSNGDIFILGEKSETQGYNYIGNMQDGATAGFKYFLINEIKSISITVSGKAKGVMFISKDIHFKEIITCIPVEITNKNKKEFTNIIKIIPGLTPLYFRYKGIGTLDFFCFKLF